MYIHALFNHSNFPIIHLKKIKNMKYILLTGRVLFSIIFLMSMMGHFSARTIAYATSAGVPMASFLVPATGVMAFLGGLSILLGYKAKIGAWIIVVFLLPVTFMMHKFWTITDPMMMQMQMTIFMKNIALTGAALMITYLGTGPLSLDAREKK